MDSIGDLTEVAFFKTVIQYSQLVAFTVMYYDYLLTLHDEVLLFWGSNSRTSMGVLFLIGRYLQLFGNAAIVVQNFGNLSNEVIVGAVLIIRTYAVYGKRFIIFIALFILVFILFILAVWAVFAPAPPPMLMPDESSIGCPMALSNEQLSGIIAGRIALVWEGMLFVDTIILCLTAYKVYRLRKSSAKDLLKMLLRDGFVYYLIISIANSVNIVTFLSPVPSFRGTGSTFANVVSATSISRLMLNIRKRAHSQYPSLRSRSLEEELTADIFVSTFDDQHQSSNRSRDLNNPEDLESRIPSSASNYQR
ncbi:hypothetical protein SCHPADRAFT_942111 [Schizopora paradoxa]|uniref:DUF6533 domain-containing protein n=1 Tax=Schizopora paradoxa TaxID=27342 RepID=A0A0H2RIH1_9AGAM|nr:hypothetical protein SCHPADRAFT_942111 [Schizopora paradoxa]